MGLIKGQHTREKRTVCVIVAGGSGVRMGSATPKQFLSLAGKPVLVRTVEKFIGVADRIIVVLPFGTAVDLPAGVEVCTGGATRFESVSNALQYVATGNVATTGEGDGEGLVVENALARVIDNQTDAAPQRRSAFRDAHSDLARRLSNCSIIAIHDGVRPLVSREIIEAAFEAAAEHGAAVPVIDAVDSFRLDGKPVDRRRLKAVQTPQAFRAEVLVEAYRTAPHRDFTDDATVVEAAGHAIHFFEGSRENIKITTPADLLIANTLWR